MKGNDFYINVDNLTHIYTTRTGDILALEDVSFKVKKGEFFVILGPSGCGKSTLLKILSGLLMPTRGKVEVNSERVTQPLKKVGIVFQSPILLKWSTVADNVLLPVTALGLPVKDYLHKVDELLELVGLQDFKDKYPRELSGGMQQRVSIARAMVLDPDFLLMDEPFGALDAITRDLMNSELLKIWEKKNQTILFITHSIDEAAFMADRVMVMSPRPGRVAHTVDIDLDRPRTMDTRTSEPFRKYVANLYGMLDIKSYT